MDILKEVLAAVSKGETKFSPEGSDETDIRRFQPLARALFHAKEEGLIGRVHFHKSAEFGEWLTTMVLVSEGLTYKGMREVENWVDDAQLDAKLRTGRKEGGNSGGAVHEPDFSRVGTMRYRRKTYETIHSALLRLRNAVRQWNQVAISHGAFQAPYPREEDHLNGMVDWGEQELSNPNISDIVVEGMTVESLRLQRAALEFAAFQVERDAREKSRGMPPAVIDSILGHARDFAAEAKRVDQPTHPILGELLHELDDQEHATGAPSHEWDVFISHASEDKDTIARPLAEALREQGLSVWFDEATLTLGDSLRQSIDRGLARSRFGIVILSGAFFSKHWPQRELDGLDAREVGGVKVILPIWHGVDQATVAHHSPTLAGRLAVSSSRGIPAMVDEILRAIRR